MPASARYRWLLGILLLLGVALAAALVTGSRRQQERVVAEIVAEDQGDADEARERAASEARVALTRALLYLNSGTNPSAAADRDIGTGLVRLADALAKAPPEEAELCASLRRLLGGWRDALPLPRAVLPDQGNVYAVAYHPDGRSFFTGGAKDSGGFVQRWDAATLRPLGPPAKFDQPVYRLFAGPGDRLVVCPLGAAILWDTAAGKKIAGLPYQLFEGGWRCSVAFRPDGKLIAVAQADADLAVYDAAGTKIDPAPADLLGLSGGLLLRDDGAEVGVLRAGRIVWERLDPHGDADGAPQKLSKEAYHRSVISRGAGGFLLAQAADDWEVELVERDALGLARRSLGRLLPWLTFGEVGDLALAPDGRTLLTARGVACLWDCTAGAPRQQIGRGGLDNVALSADGRTLAFCAAVRAPGVDLNPVWVWRWDGAAFRHLRLIEPEAEVERTALSPDGTVLALQLPIPEAAGRCVEMWDVESGRVLGRTRVHGDYLMAIHLRAHEWPLLTLAAEGRAVALRGWDLGGIERSRRIVAETAREYSYSHGRIARDGRRVTVFVDQNVGDEDPRVLFCDAATGRRLAPILRDPAASGIDAQYSADGRQFLRLAEGLGFGFGPRDGELRCLSTNSFGALTLSCVCGAGVYSFQWMPDETAALTASCQSIDLVDLNTMTQARRWRVPAYGYGSMDIHGSPAVADDGARFVVARKNGMLVFDVPPPLRGAPERVRLEIELVAGRTLDETGTAVFLDEAGWRQRWERLQQLR